MKLLRSISIVLTFGLLSGCYTLRGINEQAPEGKVVVLSSHHLFWGLTTETLDVPCKKGIAKLEDGFSFGHLLGNVFTLGIYAPKSHRITCRN